MRCPCVYCLCLAGRVSFSTGAPLTKIFRGIKFEESAWLEEYINLKTKLRIETKQTGNNFEVDFFSS